MSNDAPETELSHAPWRHSSARGKARKRALDVLYEADIRGADPLEILAFRQQQIEPPIADYTVVLVEGVCDRRAQIDELLSTYAEGWPLSRMPPVDRNIMRLGVYELMWCADVPDPVAIDEAVSLAKQLSTEGSPGFINGVLGRLQLVKEL